MRMALWGTAAWLMAVLLPALSPAAAELTVHKVFGDHMVLQQGRPVAISGTATPGAAITLQIRREDDRDAYPGKGMVLQCTYTAGADGRWVTSAPELPAGGPYGIVVAAEGAPPVKFTDVLVGEVWLGSGQSNMEFAVSRPSGRFASSLNGVAEAAAAKYPQIRLYNASSKKYISPREEKTEVVGPGWQVCTPDTAAPFSAVAYFFGREIHRELKVPVGLVSASWGGTRIEPWISFGAFRQSGRRGEVEAIEAIRSEKPEEREAKIAVARERIKQEYAVWEKKFYGTDPAATQAAEAWKQPDLDDSAWTVPAELSDAFPSGKDGVIWFRTVVDLPADWAGKEAALSLGAIDDTDETYLNGVKVGVTDSNTPSFWAAKRRYPVPAGLLKAGRNVLALRVSDFYSGGGLMGTPAERFLVRGDDASKKIPLAGPWRIKTEFFVDPAKLGASPNAEIASDAWSRSASFPSTLFNSMIAPWTVYPMRGILWYQGESNASAPEDYLALHKLLIADWRARWHNPDLAFLFVQLAGYEKHTPGKRLADGFWKDRAPADPHWARFREAQAATLGVPNTGMAVALDVGDHSDIHPADKQSVSRRLAAEALRICYGKQIVSSGPRFRSLAVKDGKAVVAFDNVGTGLAVKGGGKPGAFAVAGADGKFVWADAVVDGNTVVVSSPEVKVPAAVRYGWVSYAENVNLCNREGFPAEPFRTDVPDYLKK